jgi:general secretion pathway protein A
MYLEYFGLDKLPFTISPDPDFLYPSKGHQEALAHLSYALTDQGGLICLTGEVGTGKTTLCRALMESVPECDRVAYIFNPQLSPIELMQSLCDDLGIHYYEDSSLKDIYKVINEALVDFYASHQRVICVIDEAQSMPPALLEQVRLLTNLETHREKLLTLVLVGQPELRDLLARHDLRQLNQRITARYHLELLSQDETTAYLEHRILCAGGDQMLFDRNSIRVIWQASNGTPRLINSIADRALLGAYATGKHVVDRAIARQAVIEVLGVAPPSPSMFAKSKPLLLPLLIMALALCIAAVVYFLPFKSLIPVLSNNDPLALLADEQNLNADNCNAARAQGYVCLWVDWPLAELREINQPVAFNVGPDIWITLSEYESGYTGEALILWNAPVEYDVAVRPGQTSPVIRWVRSQLAITWDQEWTSIGPGGVQVQADPEFYDPLLERAVAEFQISKGLKADRIIGPKTLMYLQGESE